MEESEIQRKLRLIRENAKYGSFQQFSLNDPNLPRPSKDDVDYQSFYPKKMIEELDKEHLFIIQPRRKR